MRRTLFQISIFRIDGSVSFHLSQLHHRTWVFPGPKLSRHHGLWRWRVVLHLTREHEQICSSDCQDSDSSQCGVRGAEKHTVFTDTHHDTPVTRAVPHLRHMVGIRQWIMVIKAMTLMSWGCGSCHDARCLHLEMECWQDESAGCKCLLDTK